MSTIAIAVKDLEVLLDAIPSAETLFERAALFGAIKAITDGLVSEDLDVVNGYAKEKATQIGMYAARSLGFGEESGHAPDEVYTWALGHLSTLRMMADD